MVKQATDTFVAVLAGGGERLVVKGEVFPDTHELVKRDAQGSGQLFRDLDLGEESPKSAPEAAAQAAPVKPRAGKAAS